MNQKRARTQQSQQKNSIDIKSFIRGNFSKIGKIYDQKFYQKGKNMESNTPRKKVQYKKKQSHSSSTYGFSCVSRQKKGNYRFPNKKCEGQFIYEPKYLQGKHHNPQWSFAKDQKYQNDKIVEYQMCKKHPFYHKSNKSAQKDHSLPKDETTNNLMVNTTNMMKSTSIQTSADFNKVSKNYSIIDNRSTSPIGFFTKTKISKSFYLTKSELMNEEETSQNNIKEKKYMKKKYENFLKRKSRKSNDVSKGFQRYLPNYEHQKHFNNYSLQRYPTKPQYHIDFKKQLERKQKVKQPNPSDLSTSNIDFSRINKKNINLYFSKNKNEIKTRYDRVQPEPNTIIDIDLPKRQIGGMITMQKMKDRDPSLFPPNHRYLRKAGDHEIQQIYKKQICS